MTGSSISWQQDGIDTGWFIAEGVGSVRSSSSYRPEGWWFLPIRLPDVEEYDVGPSKTKRAAMSEAERLAPLRRVQEAYRRGASDASQASWSANGNTLAIASNTTAVELE